MSYGPTPVNPDFTRAHEQVIASRDAARARIATAEAAMAEAIKAHAYAQQVQEHGIRSKVDAQDRAHYASQTNAALTRVHDTTAAHEAATTALAQWEAVVKQRAKTHIETKLTPAIANAAKLERELVAHIRQLSALYFAFDGKAPPSLAALMHAPEHQATPTLADIEAARTWLADAVENPGLSLIIAL